MKRLITTLSFFILFSSSYAQVKWTVKKPFDQKNFIENKGQFFVKDKLTTEEIAYSASIDGVTYYFTKNGYLAEHFAKQENTEREKEERKEKLFGKGKKENEKEEGEFKYKTVSQVQQMLWEGTSPDVEIIVEDMVSNYYTYNDPKDKQGKTSIKAKAFKKLTYKNLYPFTDVVYEFPSDTTGIKYSIYLHPGANVNNIKISYPNNKGIELNNVGNINIKSELGVITDHQPYTYQLKNNEEIKSTFVLRNEKVGFYIDKPVTNETIVIDPWTINPNFPFTNKAYDIQHDQVGNIFIYGGNDPYQLNKYTSLGTLLWTYTTSAYGYYGDFTLDAAGNAFCIYGPWGDYCIKINAAGVPVWSVSSTIPSREIYRIYPNPVSGLLTIMGMELNSTSSQRPLEITIDPNTGTYIASIFHPTCVSGETRCMSIDANGDAFGVIFAGISSTNPNADNLIWKVNAANVTTGSVVDGYNLNETDTSNTDSYFSGFNGTAVGCAFLYTYDGITVKKWDKASLTLLGSVTIAGGVHYTTGGLCIDQCGNVYVGGPSSILEFDPNLVPITAVVTPGQVYDVNNGNAFGEIIACGNQFFGSFSFSVTTCGSPLLQAQSQVINSTCSNPIDSATVTVTGGVSPYSFTWNTIPVQTGSVLTNLPAGTYTAAIIDNSCPPLTGTVSVTITPQSIPISATFTSGMIKCNGDTVSLQANVTGGHIPYSYLWNTHATSNQIHGITAGNYSITITDSAACTNTFSVNVAQPLPITVSFTSGIIKCNGDTTSLRSNITGGRSPYTYLWSTTSTSNSLHGISAGIYSVTITDSSGCKKTANDTIMQPSQLNASIIKSDCKEESSSFIKINAGGGTLPYAYSWNTVPIQTTDSITNLTSGVYSVTVTDAHSCTKSFSETIYFNIQTLESVNIFTPNGDGRNETFFPFSYEGNDISSLISSLESYELYIYDRWGKKVFHTAQAANTWDGKETNGGNCSAGVYYWIVTINSKCENSGKQTFKGFVHLER